MSDNKIIIVGHGRGGGKSIALMQLMTDKVNALEQENAGLRAKFERAEKNIKRYKDIINRQYLRGINIIGKMEKTQNERDELSGKVGQLEVEIIEHEIAGNQLTGDVYRLESQVAVLRRTLEEIKKHVLTYGKQKSDTAMIFNLCRDTLQVAPTETIQKLQELEKYAELGRLVLKTDIYVCDGKFSIEGCKTYCDPGECHYYLFCQKRAELQQGGEPNK